MAITPATPFRSIATLSVDQWRQAFANRQSPVLAHEVDDCYAACEGWAILLDQAIGETSLTDADAIDAKNLLRMLDEQGQLRHFSEFWKPFALKYKQLYDPLYKGGVYYAGTAGVPPGYKLSLAGYKVTYIGGPECLSTKGKTCANGETYDPNKPMSGTVPATPSINASIAASLKRLNVWFPDAATTTPAPSPPPPGTGAVTFGRVPRPANYQERIIAPGVNHAWDNLGPRKPRGLVLHRMLGTLTGTDTYFRGDAAWKACTDFGIGIDYAGHDGAAFRWTQPGANVAPYASGPANGIDGDGTAFWQKYRTDPIGVSIFNRDCEAIEIAGNYDSPVSAAMYQCLVELVAWRADAWLKIPYTRWPLNNDGVHCLLGHSEITDDKPCPGSVVYGLVAQLIDDVGARLQRFQTS